MTKTAIQEQVDAIRKATQEALKSKESALQFLVDAGIVKGGSSTPKKRMSHKKK